ncbi:ornithine--oxo-acid transaminase [Natronoflexus pectinivorans]|uniref:ornithine aminotransferase n=1 Tax=Natronoflexus pectinivorans TaxID=682526 RepID=A0A4R2GDJ8_9BACT|nr:ornithine--oxo-acid transaminase [Natronoflexus pectinivorans]TCO06003.1 ornithine--oxo-acid transaminase [Natronoflexus pectinivorans]
MSKESNSLYYIDLEDQYGAKNYHPLPVVLEKGEGVFVWDVEGKRYYDFLAAYSAVNQGHCHPRLVKTINDQSAKLALTSRAFYNNQLGKWSKMMTELFGYDRMLPMNSGAEAVETALKLARKWAYKIKGIAREEAKIVVCNGNFHGRTISIISMSSDPDSYNDYGPYTPGFNNIPYDDVVALEQALSQPNVAAFLAEPIQAEAGVFVPSDGYLKAAKELCEQYDVLFIADEIQTGLGRTGKWLAVDYEDVKPDILVLGKALSGGMYPVSCVLANNEVMLTIKAGEHGSTYGGNPLAAAISMEAVNILYDEQLADNAFRMGKLFRKRLRAMNSPLIKEVRGKGLLNAITIHAESSAQAAWDLCISMKNHGVIAKPTHGNIIRFTPPLIIDESQLIDAVERIETAFKDLK